MILLGVNGGFGNTDCAELDVHGPGPRRRWIDFPRPKTGIARRCPLWPETVAAIRAAVAGAAEAGGLPRVRARVPARPRERVRHVTTELTRDGNNPEAIPKGGNRKDLIGIQFGKLLDALGIHRERVGFYALRHTFRDDRRTGP